MELKEFCNALYKASEKSNLEGFEISGSKSNSFSVNVLEGEIEKYNVSNSISVSLRVKYNGKIGVSSSSALDEEYIENMINEARENAEIIENDDVVFFSEKEKMKFSEPKTYNEELETITAAEKIALAKEMEQKALKYDSRVIRTGASMVASFSDESVLVNSNGVDLSQKSNLLYGYIAPIVKIGENMNNVYEGFCVYNKADIDVDKIVKKAVDEAIALCGADSVKSGAYKTVIRNDAMLDLFETFSPIFSAENAQKGLSMLKNKEGEKIAADCVTIVDNPHKDWGFASSAFDGEGTLTTVKNVVENGVFKTLLYDIKSATKVGKKSTGNSKGGSIGGYNMYIEKGEDSFEEILKKADNGIMITSLAGLHSGADAKTGEFSLSAQGYLIENGKLSRGVSGITFSGNFYELLKNIECLSDDLYFGLASAHGTPTVLLNEKTVIAGE